MCWIYLKLGAKYVRPLLIQMSGVKPRLIFQQQNLQNIKPALVWVIVNVVSSSFKT